VLKSLVLKSLVLKSLVLKSLVLKSLVLKSLAVPSTWRFYGADQASISAREHPRTAARHFLVLRAVQT
jgi:hypothetical protein